jgi:hypothetical protein
MLASGLISLRTPGSWSNFENLGSTVELAKRPVMSLAQLKDEVARLPSKEQRELIAFLVSLQTAKDEEFKKTLATRINDRDPAHWIEFDELQKKYKE